MPSSIELPPIVTIANYEINSLYTVEFPSQKAPGLEVLTLKISGRNFKSWLLSIQAVDLVQYPSKSLLLNIGERGQTLVTAYGGKCVSGLVADFTTFSAIKIGHCMWLSVANDNNNAIAIGTKAFALITGNAQNFILDHEIHDFISAELDKSGTIKVHCNQLGQPKVRTYAVNFDEKCIRLESED
jgi:hypothetical protein